MLAVLSAMANVRGSKSESRRRRVTIVYSLCLWLHWLVLSVQRSYVNSSIVVSVCLQASQSGGFICHLFHNLLEIFQVKHT